MRAGSKVLRITNIIVPMICVAGMFLSVYAYHVETNVHSDPTFKALCDFSEHMSCSKVFSSKYGTGLGIVGRLLGKDSFINQPNSVYGMIFYTLQSLLAFKSSYKLALVQFMNSILAMGSCVYLAYILLFILEDFCVVCVSTYVVNIVITICSYLKLRALSEMEATKKQKNASKKAS
ncbi:VKORL-like protein [Mya arenaria]|uniref:vitamin-K-epoxide reductase (warfarin-sensitive) n=1 Tax=Mya arenaria TaxID=6604 RepID=A0ABY7E0Y0_MYAAR|nr:vitamin K epoxide reductase complex subunit 1-like protein 1 [Mya arenaria]WAR03652.1 VKORL-like protein [Mya arenaria]